MNVDFLSTIWQPSFTGYAKVALKKFTLEKLQELLIIYQYHVIEFENFEFVFWVQITLITTTMICSNKKLLTNYKVKRDSCIYLFVKVNNLEPSPTMAIKAKVSHSKS